MFQVESNEIDQKLSMNECIAVMEDLYKHNGNEISSQPLRTVTRGDDGSIVLTMPALSKRLKRFAVKIVSEYPDNPSKFGLASQGGVILLFDLENGALLASFDSPSITAIRTGAVCGLAAKILSRNQSRAVAVIGSGQQARTQLKAVCAVRRIEDVKVYSRDYAHAKRFGSEMSSRLGIPVLPVRDRRDATKNSDIIITATNSHSPVIEWAVDVSAGCHINSIGTLPDRRELDTDTIRNSRLFVDVREGVLKEAGDVMFAISSESLGEQHIIADLSELVTQIKEGRKNENEVTLFKSVGFGLQDVYAASYVYAKISQN